MGNACLKEEGMKKARTFGCVVDNNNNNYYNISSEFIDIEEDMTASLNGSTDIKSKNNNDERRDASNRVSSGSATTSATAAAASGIPIASAATGRTALSSESTAAEFIPLNTPAFSFTFPLRRYQSLQLRPNVAKVCQEKSDSSPQYDHSIHDNFKNGASAFSTEPTNRNLLFPRRNLRSQSLGNWCETESSMNVSSLSMLQVTEAPLHQHNLFNEEDVLEQHCRSPQGRSVSKTMNIRVSKTIAKVFFRVNRRIRDTFEIIMRGLDAFFYPRILLEESGSSNSQSTSSPLSMENVRGGILLEGCASSSEHYERIQSCLTVTKDFNGIEGLRVFGLEYRLLPCEVHRPRLDEIDYTDDENDCQKTSHRHEKGLMSRNFHESIRSLISVKNESGSSNSSKVSTQSLVDLSVSLSKPDDLEEEDFLDGTEAEFRERTALRCHLCTRRLYHIASNTLVTEGNRKRFIADGDMYEEVSRLCQEYAHDVMIDEGNMIWITVDNEDDKDDNNNDYRLSRPIRILVNKDHPFLVGNCDINDHGSYNPMSERPSMLIATGRGKVKAGIFSRQHLMCQGVESSTAIPFIREAFRRCLNLIIVDPNVRGDDQGCLVFEKTLDYLSSQYQKKKQLEQLPGNDEQIDNIPPFTARDLFILSHSASGGHLARYLLNRSDAYLPQIRAIAFTDSTHNIQWCKTHHNEELQQLLESSKCIYFRSSNVRVEDQRQWYLHRAGEEIMTDSFWQHRFGRIKTCWAGTNHHSLTNFYAHGKIWEHFDRHLGGQRFPVGSILAVTQHVMTAVCGVVVEDEPYTVNEM